MPASTRVFHISTHSAEHVDWLALLTGGIIKETEIDICSHRDTFALVA